MTTWRRNPFFPFGRPKPPATPTWEPRYGDRVRVTRGFYAGCLGDLVDERVKEEWCFMMAMPTVVRRYGVNLTHDRTGSNIELRGVYLLRDELELA